MFGYAAVTLSLSDYIAEVHDNAENNFAELVELTKQPDGKYLSLPRNIQDTDTSPSLAFLTIGSLLTSNTSTPPLRTLTTNSTESTTPLEVHLGATLDSEEGLGTDFESLNSTDLSCSFSSSSSSASAPSRRSGVHTHSQRVVTEEYRAPTNQGLDETFNSTTDPLSPELLMDELVTNPTGAARRFYIDGIPKQYRAEIWLLLTHARELCFHNHGLYAFLGTKESNYTRQILSDVPRTLPDIEQFGPAEEATLQRLLTSYSLYCTDVGYAQGLNYVVAPLVFTLQDEDEMFWTLVAMMKDRNLERFYHPDGIYFRIVTDTFSTLLGAHYPRLEARFRTLGIRPEHYLPQWFRTFFLYTENLELNLRVMDVFLLHGIEALFRVALAIFELLHEELVEGSFMTIVTALNSLSGISDVSLLMTTAFAQQLSFLTTGLEIAYRAERERKRDKPCLFQ